MPEGEVKIGGVDMKALAERAGSSQRVMMQELEELLAIRDQLEKEDGFRYGFRTVDHISTGWDEFYRIEGHIEERKLIICKYSQVLLELSSFSLLQEKMREISHPTQIQERGADVTRCKSQLVIPLLETGSESTAQQQPQEQQQQFETEENGMVVDAVVRKYCITVFLRRHVVKVSGCVLLIKLNIPP